MLTGFPSDIILNKKISLLDVWDCIYELNAFKGMAVATVDTKMLGLQKKIKMDGLADFISCRIIDAVEIDTSFRTTVKLVQV